MALIGVDGLEWDVVLPLLAEGRLPNLARWMERGRYGRIDSTQPTLSPCIWTSIATGREREAHGILGFLRRDLPEGEPPVLYTSLDRRVPALWNVLSAHGQRSMVIGWWNTYPVEQIHGWMVAQANTNVPAEAGTTDRMLKGTLHADLPGQVHPPERAEQVLALLPRVEVELEALERRVYPRLVESEDPLVARMWAKCRWAVRADAIYRAVALELLPNEPFDLLAVYFGGPDVFGHRFWRYHEPERYRYPPSPEELAAYGEVLADAYAHVDAVLGELVTALPEGTNVLIVSDHGMGATHTDRHFTPELTVRELKSGGHPGAPPGVFLAFGPDIAAPTASPDPATLRRADLEPVGSVLDVAPTVLALRGLPVARDLDGAPMLDLLRPAFLERHPLAWVDTHATPEWHAARGAGPAAPRARIDARIEQLRSLGYLGDDE